MTRAQANLPALAVALLLVASSVGVALGLAGGAFAAANTDPGDARLAAGVSDRLVAADGPLAVRANVLDDAALRNATAALLPDGVEGRVRVGGETAAARGDPTGGATVRRIVLVAQVEERTLDSALAGGDAVTLPRRTRRATLTFDPPPGVDVIAVRANDRVVLRDPDGLDGSYDVALARYDTVRLQFDASRDLGPESVEIAYRAETTTKATLAVTVDA